MFIIADLVFLSLSDVVFILLINVKITTIVGFLTIMSRMNFVLNWVEHGKSVITSGPDLGPNCLQRLSGGRSKERAALLIFMFASDEKLQKYRLASF